MLDTIKCLCVYGTPHKMGPISIDMNVYLNTNLVEYPIGCLVPEPTHFIGIISDFKGPLRSDDTDKTLL